MTIEAFNVVMDGVLNHPEHNRDVALFVTWFKGVETAAKGDEKLAQFVNSVRGELNSLSGDEIYQALGRANTMLEEATQSGGTIGKEDLDLVLEKVRGQKAVLKSRE